MHSFQELFEKGLYMEAVTACREDISHGRGTQEHIEMLNEVEGIYFDSHNELFGKDAFLEAIVLMEEFLRIFPDSAEGKVNLADAFCGAGAKYYEVSMLEKAKLLYDRSIANDHFKEYCLWKVNEVLFEKGRIKGNEEEMERAIEHHIRMIDVFKPAKSAFDNELAAQMFYADSPLVIKLRKLAEMYLDCSAVIESTEKLDEAIAILENLVITAPRSDKSWRELGVAYRNKAKLTDIAYLERSIESIKQAMSLSSYDITIYHSLAISYQAIGQAYENNEMKDKAVHSYQLALNWFGKTLQYYKGPITYAEKAWTHQRLSNYERFPHLNEALSHYLRAYYLEKKAIKELWVFSVFLLDHFFMPNFISRFLAMHPFLGTDTSHSRALRDARITSLQFRNLEVRVHQELKKRYTGDDFHREFLLNRALIEHIAGDPITAFAYHDGDLDILWELNLKHQYYYILNAGYILHEDADKIKKHAVTCANEILNGKPTDKTQIYYATCIVFLNGEHARAIRSFEILANLKYWPALFRLAECYQQLEMEKELMNLAIYVHSSAFSDYLIPKEEWEGTYLEFLQLIVMQEEANTGWMILERLIDVEKEKALEKNIPTSRLLFGRKFSLAVLDKLPPPSISEILDMDPKKRLKLKEECQERMADIFPYFRDAGKLNMTEASEILYSYLLREHKETGVIIINDYANLLRYCLAYNKLDSEQYAVMSLFLTLKYLALDTQRKKLNIKNIAKNFSSYVIGPFFLLVQETVFPIPLAYLLKIIVDSSEQEIKDIERMNFTYFLRYYAELKDYQEEPLLDTLRNHSKYKDIQGIFEYISELY